MVTEIWAGTIKANRALSQPRKPELARPRSVIAPHSLAGQRMRRTLVLVANGVTCGAQLMPTANW